MLFLQSRHQLASFDRALGSKVAVQHYLAGSNQVRVALLKKAVMVAQHATD